jgi:hypothetical protein
LLTSESNLSQVKTHKVTIEECDNEDDELLTHLRESEPIIPSKTYKTRRIPRGLKVENITKYINDLSSDVELVQEFNKDYELPEDIDTWESVKLMIDSAVPKIEPKSESFSPTPICAYHLTEGDGFHNADVRESAKSYTPTKLARNVY